MGLFTAHLRPPNSLPQLHTYIIMNKNYLQGKFRILGFPKRNSEDPDDTYLTLDLLCLAQPFSSRMPY